MDGPALLADVRESTATELDRLGSEKSLLAATEARLEPDPVLVTAATVLATARDTLGDWAQAATDGAATDALAGAAATVEDAFETVAADLDDGTDGPDTAETVTDLDAPFLELSATGDIERVAAATIGTPLVLDRLFLQMVSFFVNEADETHANLFRELRDEMDGLLADGQDTLETLCTASDQWERAESAAAAVVTAAYDDYARRLDAMGFDPKPIC